MACNTDDDSGQQDAECDAATCDGGACAPACAHGCDEAGVIFAAGTCWPDCNPGDACCEPDGTFCSSGCDGTTCNPDCDPDTDGPCCTAAGYWKACPHGCDHVGRGDNLPGTCWPDCNPAVNCCEPDGTLTSCSHGCNGVTGECNAECDPDADACCASDGTYLTGEVHQPGTDLYWKRCPKGQDWQPGPLCGCIPEVTIIVSGMPPLYPVVDNWCNAAGVDAPKDDGSGEDWCTADNHGEDACYVWDLSWRLPTAAELSGLLQESTLGAVDGPLCDGSDETSICMHMFGPYDLCALFFPYDGCFFWSRR